MTTSNGSGNGTAKECGLDVLADQRRVVQNLPVESSEEHDDV